MFGGNDDEAEDSSMSAARYPCMPSLIALQQMRNRLHLAHTGKKLMKWTSLATGRELRKLAGEISQTCQHFYGDVRNAFILLARARYFYPILNNMVIENIGTEAAINCHNTIKSVSGVKVLHIDIVETKIDVYAHLGIEKGGDAITKTKNAWRNLILQLILLAEERISFRDLEVAHRNATKRQNVIGKVVIPRLKATIKYILSELEEKEREDNFRLKRFKQLKTKGKQQDTKDSFSMFEDEDDTKAMDQPSEITLDIVPCNSVESKAGESKMMLEHQTSHIDNVIDLAEKCKMEGILTADMDTLINTCNKVKEKMEDNANTSPLCDVCEKFVESTTEIGSSESVELPSIPDKYEEPKPFFQPCSDSTYNLSPDNEQKFGYFEKKFKEIVKVTRLENEDGSISEEKQVITIRTERRNPRRTALMDNKFLGPGGGNDFDGNDNYDGDSGGNSRNMGPRRIKSESSCRSRQMGEPGLRSCLSSIQSISTNNRDDTTNNDACSCNSVKSSKVTLSPKAPTSTSEIKTCTALPKISKTSFIDSPICCPTKSASVSGSKLESRAPSQHSTASCKPMSKPVSKSVSIQTSCKEVPIKMPMNGNVTCSLPIFKTEKDDLDNTDSKIKTISTDAIWRDAWTSTTDLIAIPSQMPSRITSPSPSATSKKSLKKLSEKNPNSCCTIKLIAKPPKRFEQPKEKEDELDVVLKGIHETLQKIIQLPAKSNECCKMQQKPPENKNIYKNGISKLSCFTPSKGGVKEIQNNKNCHVKQKATESKSVSKYCWSKCGSFSSSEKSSMKSQSSSGKMCQANIEPELEIEDQICPACENLDDEDKTSICSAMAQTMKSSGSSKSVRSTKSCPETKDASTSTNRSARFDVRPITRRRTASKSIWGLDCCCKSDSQMLKNRSQKPPPKRCKSFNENEYYYFRW